jgi:hypothetical protein
MADLKAFEAVLTCRALPADLERAYRKDGIRLQLVEPGILPQGQPNAADGKA